MKRKIDDKINGSKVLKVKEKTVEDVPGSFHYSDNKESLYRPPTSEEMNSLKETENLFQSSLLHMQINELLSEVCLKKKKRKLEETLHSLNELLISLPDGEEHDVTELSWLPDKIHIPLPPLPGPAKGKFQFLAPKSVKVIGSYLLQTLCKPHLNIDIAVQLPQKCICGKDYLNFRYHYKRGLYLAILASYIRKSKLFKKVEFSLHYGNLWKPILVVTPKGKASSGMFAIRLFITLPTDAFKLHRFSPKVNNVRHHWFYGQQEKELNESDPGPSTPHYNSSILIDMLMEQHVHFLYSKISQNQSIIDAIVLCKVWLHQRQLNEGCQGFTGFHVSMVVAYLLQTNQVNKQMSSYQILRIFWQFLVSKDLTSDGISMVNQKSFVDDHMPSVTDFHEWFEVVFVDSSGFLNLLADMTKMAFKQLTREAKLALEFLDSQSTNSFDSLFMKKIHFITRFDNFFHIKGIEVLKTVVENLKLNSEIVDRASDRIKVHLSLLETLLQKALGNRINLLAVQPEPSPKWSLKEKPPLISQHSVTIGLILNMDNAANVLEKGPNADDIEAKAFREFWGEKSELRRFQDGTITEAVVWNCSNASEKRRICEQIIKHILNRHAEIDPSQIVFVSNKLESLLEQRLVCSSKTKKKEVATNSTGEEEIQTVIRTFESLGKQLRSLNLPLSINSIQGLSPVLRGTEVYPAAPRFINHHDVQDDERKELTIPEVSKKSPPWCPVTEVLIMFETSGQWPDDIDAIQRLKAAFLLKIASLLRNECQLPSVANTKYIDVLKDGYAFRIKLGHYREMVLFQQSNETGVLEQVHKDNAKILEREIVLMPVLSSKIHGIQQQYSSFGGSVRLAKRWISSQMLMGFFSEECIELIVAYLFLSPSPYTVPGSPTVGFLRFLLLLATFDWKNNPLIVNINNELTGADCQGIQSHFLTNRAQLPPMFIATPGDKQSSYWTNDNPSFMILRRVTLLSEEAFFVLHNQLTQYSKESIDFKQIFRAPVEDYDVVITLHSKYNPRLFQAVDSTKFLTYQTNSTLDMVLPVVNFDPVLCYLNELRESFSEIAFFFHDTYGGDTIGVVWKPTAFETSQFKVLQSQYRVPVDNVEQNESLVAPNISAILSDFEILGEDLVKEMKTNNATT